MSQVRDIMQKKVITIELQRTVQDAAVILKEKHISFLVVVKDSKPVGVISERDIVRKIVAESVDSKSTQLEVIMSKNFKWVEPNASIESAVQKMLNNNIYTEQMNFNPQVLTAEKLLKFHGRLILVIMLQIILMISPLKLVVQVQTH